MKILPRPHRNKRPLNITLSFGLASLMTLSAAPAIAENPKLSRSEPHFWVSVPLAEDTSSDPLAQRELKFLTSESGQIDLMKIAARSSLPNPTITYETCKLSCDTSFKDCRWICPGGSGGGGNGGTLRDTDRLEVSINSAPSATGLSDFSIQVKEIKIEQVRKINITDFVIDPASGVAQYHMSPGVVMAPKQ